jgi:NAD(P)-dependent dehydrogenase (short-subunit alcohol dehydrogenase family)
LGREGAKVVVAARRDDEGEETARAIRDAHGEAHFVRADVTREVEVAALVEQMMSVYGRLDAAFNNAGLGGAIAPLTELAEETWHDQIAGNLTSVFLSMKHEIPAMLQGGGGSIVNTASVLGLVGIGGIAPYVAAKHGVIGLTRATALELAQSGIRVNAVAPAVVDTSLFRSSLGATEEGVRGATALHPIGRLGTPEEIASLVLYLASDEASFLTGAALPIDGGWSAQ